MPEERHTVLLIEDNRAYQRLVQECLRDGGGGEFEMEWVGLLADGLERLQDGGVDVVLLDLLLPDNMGTDTLLKVREHAPDVPVVIFTGVEDDDVAEKALEAGAQGFLHKGRLTGRTLVGALRATLQAENPAARRGGPRIPSGRLLEALTEDVGQRVGRMHGHLEEVLANASPRSLERLEPSLGALADELREARGLVEHLNEYQARSTVDPGRRAPVAAADCYDDALARLRGLIERTGAHLTRDPLPQVRADPSALCRIFELLLENAVRHTAQDHPRAHTAVEPDGNNWTFSVEDDGVGLAEGDTERIFEPLVRGRQGTRPQAGGMGLALARELVHAMGGTIWAKSPGPGQGTTVCFTLPAATPPQAEEGSARAQVEAPDSR